MSKPEYNEARIAELSQDILDNSTVGTNGVRTYKRGSFMAAMEAEGVTKEVYEKVQTAQGLIASAAVLACSTDNLTKLGELSKDDLGNVEVTSGIKSTTRLPTLGGSTDITVPVVRSSRIPGRYQDDGVTPLMSTKYGPVKIDVTAERWCAPETVSQVEAAMKSALGIS